MNKKSGIVSVYIGDEVSVIHLKGELESADIQCLVKSDFDSGMAAGFMGGTPSTYELFILEIDMEAARPIIEEFLNQTPD